MRKVIDSSAYSNGRLSEYLAASKNNIAVISDYSEMEAFNSDDLQAVFERAEILCEHQAQLLFLKNTATVCRLSGRRAGLISRLIDTSGPKEFAFYCLAVRQAERGAIEYLNQLREKAAAANAELDEWLGDAQRWAAAVAEATKLFSAREQKAIRLPGPHSPDLKGKILTAMIQITCLLHVNYPNVRKDRPAHELVNTYLFRVAICTFLLTVEWISVGRTASTPQAVRNDLIDSFIAAYATFFDGLLSSDLKQQRIYSGAMEIVTVL
ncbi:MAG: hypothetical protein ACREPT_10215 [Rudaea sp.]